MHLQNWQENGINNVLPVTFSTEDQYTLHSFSPLKEQ
jgi:hypothetical protein